MPPCRYLIILLSAWLPFAGHSQNATIDSLQRVVALGKKDTAEARALLSLCAEYARFDPAKAKQATLAALTLCISFQKYDWLGTAYTQMVSLQNVTGHPDSALVYLERMKQLSQEHPADKIRANYYFSAGLFHRVHGNYKVSQPYMLEALKVYTAMDNKEMMAGQSLNIGNNYSDMGESHNAMIFHLKGLKIFEELDNKRGQAFCTQSIGNDFVRLGQFKAALPYLEKALILKKELGDLRGQGSALTSLSEAMSGLHDPENKAIAYAKTAIQFAKETRAVTDEAKANMALGHAYFMKQEFKNATLYYNEAKICAARVKDSTLVSAADAKLINLQLDSGKMEKTEKKLFSTLQNAREKGDKYSEIDNYKFLSNFYAGNHQFDKALDYNEKYHAAYDSFENNQLTLQLKTLDQQYNVEKKEKEIALKEKEIALLKKDQELKKTELQKEKTIKAGIFLLAGLLLVIGLLAVNRYRILQRTRRLIEIEKLRNTIARDLHDDIGSALSSIHINSNTALSHPEQEEVVKSQLEKIKKNSGRMMESMGDIVWAINPVNDSVDNLLVKMKEFLAEILEPQNIQFRLVGSEGLNKIKLDVGRRKEIYLIFKEAVNNIAKYSQCAEVVVSILHNGKEFSLRITDNGRGFDHEAIRPGNGLRNMEQRAAAIGGDLRIDATAGKGTTVLLHLPLA